MTDLEGLGRTLNAVAGSLTTGGKDAERAVAAAIAASVDRKIAGAVGSDRKLSGTTRTTGKKSRKTGRAGVIKAYVKDIGSGQLVGVTGPLQLVENDIDKHIVTSRYVKGASYTKVNAKGKTVKGRATRESRIASVAFGLGAAGGGRRAVLHWGDNYARFTFASSKGRHPWRDGVAGARQQVPAVNARVMRQAIGSALRN